MKKLALILTTLTAAVACLHADSIFSDNFSYPDGGIVTNSSGIWIQNTGTAGSMLVSNSTLIVSTSRTEDIAHQFPSTYTTNGPTAALYSSFTLKCTGLPTAGGTYFAHFSGTNAYTSPSSGIAGYRARIYASLTNLAAGVAPPGQFYLSIQNSGYGNALTNGGQWTTALSTNVTYSIVTKYVLATGSSTLWISPTVEGDTSVTDPQPVPYDFNNSGFVTNGPNSISFYSFRQATGEGTMLINDLKVGTAFSDVAGANTSPTISPVPNQSTSAGVATGPINFVVGDDSPASGLILTKGSSNPTLVPTNNIVFGGADPTNRTVTITPAAGQQGSSIITIFVSDGVNISSTSFQLTVGAPSISPIANQFTYINTAMPAIPFTVSDSEGDSLTVAAASSNPALIPAGNVVVGGSGANRTITLTPLTGQTGVTTITLSVNDTFNTNSTSFIVSVSPQYGVIFSDDFSYSVFLQDTALQGADSSPWAHAGSGAGTNYDLLVINGAAQLSMQRSEDLAASLANSPFASDSGLLLYASFSITVSNLPTMGGDYFAHFRDTLTGTTFRDKMYLCTTNAAPGYFRLGIANAANSVSVTFPLDLTTNQTYTVVTRYNTATAESVLWVNPANESSLHVTAQDTTTVNSIAAFGLRQSTGEGISYLDNLKIGTSFGDVATISVAPIPLGIQTSGTNVVLTWSDASFHLQSASSVAGTYTTINGATSPFTTNTAASQLFFRLSNP